MEKTLELQELFQILRKRLVMIVTLMILGMAISSSFTHFFMPTIYQSYTELVLVPGGSTDMPLTQGEISANLQMINTFNEVIISPLVLNQVIETLEMEISVGSLRSMMNARNSSNSQVITLTVRNESPALARDIANAAVDIFKEEISHHFNMDNLMVLASAQTPEEPVSPRLMLNIALGLIGGAMSGILLAYLMEFFNKVIRTEREIEKSIGGPVIGVIPLIGIAGNISKRRRTKKILSERRMSSLVTLRYPKSPVSEQYRIARTNIQFSMIDNSFKMLTCTSALSGEGKSTTIANLAVAFARQEQKVLLVDADLRKPVLHQIMKVNNQKGLTTLITLNTTIAEAIISTKINNLFLMPSGPIPPNPSELLGSKRMKSVLEELSNQFDLILFDTPPLLAVTDAQVLSSYCDGAILVLKGGQTKKQSLIKAKELLDHAQVNMIGTILNGVDSKLVSYSYYGER